MNYNEEQYVYHYTSPEGAFSILENKTIRFTATEYLNDKCEYDPHHNGKRSYVFSTSNNPDNLALWNYYVKNDAYRGYNLGIKVEDFVELLQSAITQENESRSSIDTISLEFRNITYDSTQMEQNIFTKSEEFRCEEEYRFVIEVPINHILPKEYIEKRFFIQGYRVGASGIITPYLEWKFTLDDKKRLFTKITLAPMIEKKLAMASFKRYLHKDVYQNIDIVPSKIKLRF